MLRLRSYKKDDAETIMSWIKDEKVFYKWTAGIFGGISNFCGTVQYGK